MFHLTTTSRAFRIASQEESTWPGGPVTPPQLPTSPGTISFCLCLGLFPDPIPCHREDREAEGGKSLVGPTRELPLAEPSSGKGD